MPEKGKPLVDYDDPLWDRIRELEAELEQQKRDCEETTRTHLEYKQRQLDKAEAEHDQSREALEATQRSLKRAEAERNEYLQDAVRLEAERGDWKMQEMSQRHRAEVLHESCEELKAERDRLLKDIKHEANNTYAEASLYADLLAEHQTLEAERNRLKKALMWYWYTYHSCVCGARAETPNTHPHVIGCDIANALDAVQEEER